MSSSTTSAAAASSSGANIAASNPPLPRLGPAWSYRGGGQGNRGFQPPPAVPSSEETTQSKQQIGRSRSASSGSVGDKTPGSSGGVSSINSFSALLNFDGGGNDDDGGNGNYNNSNSGSNGHNGTSTSSNKNHTSGPFKNRSEALMGGNGSGGAFGSRRHSTHASTPLPFKGSGRSLADLVARAPTGGVSRAHSGGYRGGPAPSDSGFRERPSQDGSEKKVIRFTRERLLSMRPQPIITDVFPESLVHVDPSIISNNPQEPVCFDDFDADEIWAQARPARGALAIQSKTNPPVSSTPTGIRGLSEGSSRGRGGEIEAFGGANRWQRGVALPPAEADAAKRGVGSKKGEEAENPEDLWDDPVDISGVGGDLSQYGALLDDVGSPMADRRQRDNSNASSPEGRPSSDGALDLDDLSEAAKQFEYQLHGTKSRSSSYCGSEDGSNGLEGTLAHLIDPKRPLAFAGTTIRSGSGDDVNVFEDFGAPSSEGKKISGGDEKEDPSTSATSRLMKMIGVEGSSDGSSSKLMSSWRAEDADEEVTEPVSDSVVSSAVGGDSLGSFLGGGSMASSVPSNPWGNPILSVDVEKTSVTDGRDLGSLLTGAHVEQNDTEKIAAEEEQRRQLEENHRVEKEKQRQASLQAHAEAQRAKEAQTAAAAADAQRHQQPPAQQATGAQYNTQVEQILMERIANVLEAAWGRSDLGNLLSNLHTEDSRVIPLLGTIEDLKALISRHPNRITLVKDPGYGVEMAVLIMSNAQFLQKQRDEEFQRQRQQQIMLEMQRAEEEARAREQAAAAAAAIAAQQQQVKITNDPWFYADPQGNIQGPFKGEEMRQWLDAGYFKGDLPISQNPNGSFRSLTSLFPDISIAFQPPSDTTAFEEEQAAQAAAAIAAAQAKEEEERLLAEQAAIAAAAAAAEQARIDAENKAQEAHHRREKEAAAAAAAQKEADAFAAKQISAQTADQNASSVQLKMLLGLNSAVANQTQSNDSNGIVIGSAPSQTHAVVNDDTSGAFTQTLSSQQQRYPSEPSSRKTSSKSAPLQPKKIQVQPRELKEPSPTFEPAPLASAPVRVQSAWGGAATSKSGSKKSIAEIQQEEARVSARLKERNRGAPHSSSGWANIAASGGGVTAWSSGSLKQDSVSMPVAGVTRVSSVGSVPGMPQIRSKQIPKSGPTSILTKSSTKQPKGSAVEDFGMGGKMSLSLESWCKEQMKKLNGSDDLTLIAFCMTLTDPVEIRQYLTAYLGSSGQVNNFATEFINRKGGGKVKQEEWESAGNAKKGRNRKKSITSAR